MQLLQSQGRLSKKYQFLFHTSPKSVKFLPAISVKKVLDVSLPHIPHLDLMIIMCIASPGGKANKFPSIISGAMLDKSMMTFLEFYRLLNEASWHTATPKELKHYQENPTELEALWQKFNVQGGVGEWQWEKFKKIPEPDPDIQMAHQELPTRTGE